ncbi:MAG: serine hydrolase [Pyrinomonadaceae bacterium]
MPLKILWVVILLSFVNAVSGQTDLVSNEGIVSDLHRANIGKVTFMGQPIPMKDYKEADFLTTFELKDPSDLSIRTFMGNSLTNYLHRLAPDLSADELAKSGNYQFSFLVNGKPIYKENLHPGAGGAESKNTRTVFRVPLISTTNEDSWGRFLWNRFMMSGGEDALTEGKNSLEIEIRPYLNVAELKVGELIATGKLQILVTRPKVDRRQIAIQQLKPKSGLKISSEAYDHAKIEDLNLKIGQNLFKEITSLVVVKNGKLLIEEYFNGADRDTLHDTRSVGKSFASAITGIAIKEGYIKNENQTLGEFYDLKRFANYSTEKSDFTLKSLLTMSSAFDGSDDNEDSPGNEEKMYPTNDWIKFALDLPVNSTRRAGKDFSYFTAGVVILGDILHRSVPGGLEKYSDRMLFQPLGISSYKWQYTPQKVANTAGGLQLRAIDLAKFGQLYKSGGVWNGKRLVPQDWIVSSLSRQVPLPNGFTEYYGYLFWNKTFYVNGKPFETYYASGNGGNRIFIFKDQPLVVVITAKAFNKPYAHSQTEKVVERFVLPAIAAKL